MELRDFAENVLFASTLAAKLAPPSLITDFHPGPPLTTPAAPGRPAELVFKDSGSSKSRFPGLHQLEHPAERGRLLHFFANHELLAVELMALVLLRFPDAPAAFRRGILQTLKDEQEHTRLYLDRMKACGVAFGDLPVSGYFWRAVSGMQSPLDYVAGLSLTFEQANLDFARHFALGFRAVGDSETASLLDRIYHDEIAHVAYGLKWFRRWKSPGIPDWDAFCQILRFPLSPQRAKGFSLNVEGRLAAGFEPGFIAELDAYSQSKGRTPTVLLFNPFAEAFIANGPSFTPARFQAALARNLAHLPMFLGRQDDVVLVHQRPRVEFLSGLKQAGFPLPEFVPLSSSKALATLAQRKLGALRPWAWSPDSLQILAPLFPSLTGDSTRPENHYNASMSRLFSKAWSALFLRDVLGAADDPWLCTLDDAGLAVDTPEAAFEAIQRIRCRGHHRVVIKEDLGLAGSNALRLWEPEVLENQRRWIHERLQSGTPLVVEPWLDREFDFSVQLERTRPGLRILGYTALVNDARGQFQANWAGPDHAVRLPGRIAELLRDPERPPDLPQRLLSLFSQIRALLESRLADLEYLGPLGIDAFVYRAADGRCRLKPVVEINPRHTMGRLTLELMHRVQAGSFGLFRILNRAALRASGHPDFPSLARSFAHDAPLQFSGHPIPRIREGIVCLSDPSTAESCLAIFQVSRTAPQSV